MLKNRYKCDEIQVVICKRAILQITFKTTNFLIDQFDENFTNYFQEMNKLRFFSATVLFLAIVAPVSIAQTSERARQSILRTPAEMTNFVSTPRYPETIAYSQNLDAASPKIVLKYIGSSPEGRKIPLLIANEGGSQKRAGEKAVVLIQAGIHAGEPDGKDAGFALFRDIALGKFPKSVLRQITILFIPILNPDGHELFSEFNRVNQNGPEKSGFRANSANLNLNRDYLKADTPEIRAWLRLWNEWKPDFFIDCHVTDGADFRYNITYEFSHHHEMDAGLTKWMRDEFEGKALARIDKKGNLLHRYIQMIDRRDPSKGIATFIATPRFATGYSALRNRIGLLVEAHSLKDFRTRVKGTHDLIVESLSMVAASGKELRRLNRLADNSYLKNDRSVVLRQRIGRKSTVIDFKGYDFELFNSAISGTKEILYKKDAKDYRVLQYDQAEIVTEKDVPRYYVVPPQWQKVIGVLRAHGVPMKRLENEISVEVDSYKFENPRWRNAPFEGRFNVSAKAVPTKSVRVLERNSVLIQTRNPFWMVTSHFLEPEAPDSAFAWGFFDAIFERKEYAESYIMENIAKKMLAESPELRKEFDEKLKDPKFAKSPRARVNFFYERSEYYDKRIGVYPVSKIDSEVAVKSLEKNIR